MALSEKQILYRLLAAFLGVMLLGVTIWFYREVLGFDSETVWELLLAFLAIFGGNAIVSRLPKDKKGEQ